MVTTGVRPDGVSIPMTMESRRLSFYTAIQKICTKMRHSFSEVTACGNRKKNVKIGEKFFNGATCEKDGKLTWKAGTAHGGLHKKKA